MKIAGKKMTREPLVLYPIDDSRDIAEINRGIVRPAPDDEIAIAFRVFDLAVRPERDRLGFAIELPGARISGAGADGSGQIVEGQVPRHERAGVDLDPDRAPHAIDVYLGDAGQDVDSLLHLSCAIAVELAVG